MNYYLISALFYQNVSRYESAKYIFFRHRGTAGEGFSIMVNNKDLGRIIGKGGCKIRELQENSGARIQIRKELAGDAETPVDITGSDEAISKAQIMVEDVLSSYESGRGGTGDRGTSRDSVRNNAIAGEKVTIEIDKKDVGKVIGKGGSKIREIEDTAGVRVKIRSDDEDEWATPIDLIGSAEGIKMATEMIEQATSEGKPKRYDNYGSSLTWNEEDSLNRPVIDWVQLNANKDRLQQEKWIDYGEVVKHFYIEDPDVAIMRPAEVANFRHLNNNIIVTDLSEDKNRNIPNPVQTFDQAFCHYGDILAQINKQGFERPSPIQCQAWPVILQGLDLIGIAQTGTGKTLAFLLPGLIHIENQPIPREERRGPTMLVLSPTRELAQQIEQETKKINYKGIKCVCIYGGGSRRQQIDFVSKGVEIVVATPGRLNDLIMNELLDIKSVSYLVLDEADRMLDMGFEPQIRKIMIDIRPDRQTIMTSATWPEGVRRLGKQFLKDPVQIFINTLDLAACHSVTQLVEMVPESEKKERIYEFIANMESDDKVLIFVGKKVIADDLSSDFSLNEILCQCIHGDREQEDREAALREFKDSDVRILIATDVASRGLDVKDITHVVNYDFPRNIEDYVHRVGRTGRAGATGIALTFISREDWRYVRVNCTFLHAAFGGMRGNVIKRKRRDSDLVLVCLHKMY